MEKVRGKLSNSAQLNEFMMPQQAIIMLPNQAILPDWEIGPDCRR